MKIQLIEDWKTSYKKASIQLAAFVAILAGIMTANPSMLLGLIAFLPQGNLRIVASAIVALVVFIIPAATRLFQKKPPC